MFVGTGCEILLIEVKMGSQGQRWTAVFLDKQNFCESLQKRAFKAHARHVNLMY